MILQGAGAATLPIHTLWFPALAAAGTMERPYADPDGLLKLPFGTRSHQLEPWRAYVETVPASRFMRGIGLVASGERDIPASILRMIAAHGVTNLRLEIGWSKVDYKDESRIQDTEANRLNRLLLNCVDAGLRPLVLLNANQGSPTPERVASAELLANAPAGSRTVFIRTNAEIIPGRTGLSNLSEPYWAAEILITAVNADGTLTLSKPLPRTLKAGERIDLATLKYEPFSEPGSPRNEATMKGWLTYVDTVSDFVTGVLKTAKDDDKGFDLEIWNELSFGTKFLYINNYYETPVANYVPDLIWGEIARRTAERIAARGAAFSGVALVNGFAATVPWPASSEQHPRISALSKHPYVNRITFPKDTQKNVKSLDAAGRATDCEPRYTACFPEYAATAIQTETIIRDLAPITTAIYQKDHGRNARRVGGVVSPVSVWLTEAGISPRDIGPPTERDAATLKMLAALRYLLFYLNKGAERVYLYDIGSGDMGYGLVREDALAYAGSGASFEPNDDRFASSALRILGRVCAVMRQRMSESEFAMRSLSFGQVMQSPIEDGAACDGKPPETLVLLPYQINQSRFAVAYYAMSRNLLQVMPRRLETVRIEGLSGHIVSLRSYDPIDDRWSSPTVQSRADKSVVCSLMVSDMPQLLILEEQENA